MIATILLALSLLWPAPWKFLEGEWTAEGGGAPGQGTGGFSFRFELQDRILVRKNWARYPTSTHEDLMIVYPEADGTRAIFFDGEGHVIHYTATIHEGRIEFLSDGSPQYRLTYTQTGSDTLAIKFEIAQPGKPFTTYLDGKARRKK